MNTGSLLVGSTGFVGQNLLRQHHFDLAVHSADVHRSFGSRPEICIYAGMPSAMYLAESDPQADFSAAVHAWDNIRKICPQKLVLISTIAVYRNTKNQNEQSCMETDGLSVYGRNRLYLEQKVRENFFNALVIRLPALYGIGLKKNFLYDLHRIVPSMLTEEKYVLCCKESDAVRKGYSKGAHGFLYLNGKVPHRELKSFFEKNCYNALSFTDSRSKFQFYPLCRLWEDIVRAAESGLETVNLCTPQLCASDIYTEVTGKTDWKNYLEKQPYDYDIQSIHAECFGGKDGYLCRPEQELEDIKRFMDRWKDET